jgi:mono/diheme cytochrome c family protein
MPNFEFATRRSSGCRRRLQLPARDPAGAGDAGADGATRLHGPGRNLVHRRNCVGCHTIEGTGGDYLKLVAEPSLGPPLLTPEGARVQHDWLYAFLRGPITIRPWLDVRMPTFGLNDQNLNGVIQYFGAVSERLEAFRTPEIVPAKQNPGVGKELRAAEVPAVPRPGAVPKDRGRRRTSPICGCRPTVAADWIADWMRAPSRTSPGRACRRSGGPSQVVLPAVWRRCRNADSRDPDHRRRCVAAPARGSRQSEGGQLGAEAGRAVQARSALRP